MSKLKIFSIFLAFVLAFFVVGCKQENNAGGTDKSVALSSKQSDSVKNDNSNESDKNLSESSKKSETQENSSTSQSKNEDYGGIDTPLERVETIYHKPINSTADYSLVETVYKTYDTVLINANVCDYGADLTGKTDSTSAIKSAIDRVKNLGGGTVYLPVGKYLVTDTITVPEYVTLRGDWQCPDSSEKLAYGTVILAKPSVLSGEKPCDKPLFSLSGHSGIDGLTFYYVDQNISVVKRYGYTIYADSPVTATIKNVTMINSCYGVGISLNTKYNELVNIENFYGTFLFNAITHNATTDVGFYNNINVKNDYWLNNVLGEKPNKNQLGNFTRENLTAIVLGDLDDQLIANVSVSDAKYGFYFTTGIREDAGFWGVVYNARLDCETGVYADYLNSRSGVVFTNSILGNVINNSPVGAVKVSGTICSFSGSGISVTENGNAESFADFTLTDDVEFNKTTKLYVADGLIAGGQTDNSQKLNQILSSIKSGGVLVIPNGVYRVDSKISVPSNVEIRSTQGVFSRTNQSQNGKNGVVFVTYARGETFTLANNSGIRGIRIWHAKNDFKTAETALNNQNFSEDISVKALGANAYAFNCETVGAYVGFDFSNADNHILKSNYGISYKNFIVAGGDDGLIISCLSNPNFMTRSNLYDYFVAGQCSVENWKLIRNSGESNADFLTLRDSIGRTYTKMVKLVNADGEKCLNVFCYGEAGLFDVYNSKNVLLVNTSLDFIRDDKFVYELSGGDVTVIGSLRVYGTSIGYNFGVFKACGRIAFGELKEGVYDSEISTVDEIKYVDDNAERFLLFDCDYKPDGFNLTLNADKSFVASGSGSWKFVGSGTKTVGGAFTSVNIGKFSKGYLHCRIYATNSDIGDGQIEITSSGGCDKNEMNWSFSQAVKKQGWNDVYLALPSAGTTGGNIDLTKVNFLRVYVLNGTSDYYIDSIEFVV